MNRNVASLVTVLSTLALAAGAAGCAKEEPSGERLAWNCVDVATPGGSTLECTSTGEDFLSTDGPAGGGSTDSSGSTDGSGGSTGTSGGSTDGPSGAGELSGDAIAYDCYGGELNCPPAAATAGRYLPGDSGSGGGSGANGNGGKSSDGSDASGGKGKGNGNGSGGGSGSEGGSGGGSGSGDGSGNSTDGSGGGDHYDCVQRGNHRTCTQTTDGSSGDGSDGSSTGGNGTGGNGTGGNGAGTTTDNGINVTHTGSKDNGDGTSTHTYEVDESAAPQDLSNWVLGLPGCDIVDATKGYEIVHPDPNAGLHGVKWETGDGFSKGSFSVTVSNATRTGSITFAAKAPGVEFGKTTGPICE